MLHRVETLLPIATAQRQKVGGNSDDEYVVVTDANGKAVTDTNGKQVTTPAKDYNSNWKFQFFEWIFQ